MGGEFRRGAEDLVRVRVRVRVRVWLRVRVQVRLGRVPLVRCVGLVMVRRGAEDQSVGAVYHELRQCGEADGTDREPAPQHIEHLVRVSISSTWLGLAYRAPAWAGW